MIHFFRHIRRKLSDSNQFLKYSKYAVGEILLVVIGILIALQINTWNDERKRQALKEVYKRALIEDLQKDIIRLKMAIDTTIWDIENSRAIGEKISNNKFEIDSIMKLYRNEFHFFISVDRNFNRNTLEALLSTGNIDLFDDAIYDELMKFNNLQKEVVSTIETELGFYMNYLTQSDLPQIDEVSIIQGENLDKIWNLMDKDKFILGLNSVLNSKSIVNKFNLDSRKKLLKETESLLKILSQND